MRVSLHAKWSIRLVLRLFLICALIDMRANNANK